MPKTSIIIVNFQSRKFLKKCLFSVEKKINSQFPIETIIINEDSKEDLSELEKNFPFVQVINQRKNNGFGAASNLGAEKARSEILFFLNPDTEIISDNIGEILEIFQKNPQIAVVGSGVFSFEKEAQEWSVGREVNFFELILNNFGFARSRKIWEDKKERLVDWVSGTAMFVKKDRFFAVGGFDEKYFMYFEDMDFCRKIRKNGEKILYQPHFQVFHYGGGSYQNQKKQKTDYYRSQDYYFKKNFGSVQAFLVRLLRKIFV